MTRKIKPPDTPEAVEQENIALAQQLARQQLREGTATSQTITHYLKLSDKKYDLELKKLEKETIMLQAKTDALQTGAKIEEMFEKAMRAMSDYSGDNYEDI